MISVFVIWILGSGSEFSVWAYRNYLSNRSHKAKMEATKRTQSPSGFSAVHRFMHDNSSLLSKIQQMRVYFEHDVVCVFHLVHIPRDFE